MPLTPCPYCGHTSEAAQAGRCSQCNGLFEPMSRKATQLAMGPWFVRDEQRPFMPGFSLAILQQQVSAGRITADTIVRGPSTNQFWMRADRTPGLSRLLGVCHECSSAVQPGDATCSTCKADLTLPDDVDKLGLAYVTQSDRDAAQQELSSKSTSKPKPSREPAPSKKEDTDPSVLVDPDLLKPVEPKASTVEEQVEDYEDAYAEEDEYEIVEDLWHGESATPRRRRKAKKGVDPLVLGMGVLLLCTVAIGMVMLITSGPEPTETPDGTSTTGSNEEGDKPATPTIQRSAAQVASVRDAATDIASRLKEEGVPETYADRFGQASLLLDQAKQFEKDQALNAAFQRYSEARAQLQSIEGEMVGWLEQEQTRLEIADIRKRVESLRKESAAAQAERWSPQSWGVGETAWKKAQGLLAAGKLAEAAEPLGEAENYFQMSLGRAQIALVAVEAQEALSQTMKRAFPEAKLNEHAPDLVRQFKAKREEGNQHMASQTYDDAERAYSDATDLLVRAVEAVELSQYRKVIAYDAGYRAAGVLLGVAAGDGIDSDGRSEMIGIYNKLLLEENPATTLVAGKDADYKEVAARLVHAARDAIAKRHGEPVQACYRAGFQTRIIEQTLATSRLTDGQKKRVHQSLGVFEEQATAAGWDTAKLMPALEAVRAANRNAKLNTPPTMTRDAFKRLIAPMQQRQSAAKIMDPTQWPSDPTDPELFPGLGLRRR